MPKILILHDPIGEPLYAPRMRFLCKYLTQKGWDVTLCSQYLEKLRFEHDYRIELVRYYRFHRNTVAYEIEWFFKFLLIVLFDHKEHFFLRRIEKLFGNEHFDLVCCSCYSTFPLKAAYKFAKKHNIPLHIDLRDIAEQGQSNVYIGHSKLKFITNIYRKINVVRRNRILRKVTSITTVSPWHVNFVNKVVNKNVNLIYNGFDSDIFYPQDIENQYFRLVYTGSLLPMSQQDPTPLFEAIHNLKKEEKINPSWFAIDFYVSEKAQRTLLSMAAKYHVSEFCFFNRYVSPHKVPPILHNSSICLIFANKCCPNGPQGIMTTKFFEYLGVEKPLMCIRSDESILAQTIEETNAGISVTHTHQIEDFILEKVDEWRKNGFTRQPVNQEKRLLFTRQRQAEQFITIFEKLMQK